VDRKIKIILATADIGIGAFLVYQILFHGFTIAINYELQQLIFASGASGIGITLLYWKRLKEYNPKFVKLIELLLYLVAPTVASIPLLAKVNYFLILIVCYTVPIGWFNFGLIKIGTTSDKEEEKKNELTRKTIGIMIGMLMVFLVMITWLITIICAYQCKN
jgi:hypothetical protein